MHESHLDLVLLGVMLGAAGLLVLAWRIRVPYPILLVVGGAALGFIPGLPMVELSPDAVLVLFLPLLLYSAAFFSSLRDLKDNAGTISSLAIGLVVVTTLVLGVVAHAVIDDLSWAAAFTLGAILAPTDPVAATAIAARAGAPRRFQTLVEGESLVNDSTALIAYKVALGAALTGSFSLVDAGISFVWEAAAGVAIGVLVGVIVAQVRRFVEDPPTEITISLLTPFFAYLPAEALGVSAVLAAVTSGVWLGWRAPELVTPGVRLQLYAVWELVTFVLNAALFILLGLQLRGIVERISDDFGPTELLWWAALVFVAMVAVRFVYIYVVAGLRWWRRSRDPESAFAFGKGPLLTSWCGMRGAVSLAAALALPLDFPGRDLVVFIVYAVLFATLLIQGLTLQPLIRWVDIQDDGRQEKLEVKARIKAAKAAIECIDELVGEDWVLEDTATRARGLHEFRIRRFKARLDEEDDGAIDQRSINFQHLQRQTIAAQRARIVQLRNEGFINDTILHRIERDLDLEYNRLELPDGDGGPPVAPLTREV